MAAWSVMAPQRPTILDSRDGRAETPVLVRFGGACSLSLPMSPQGDLEDRIASIIRRDLMLGEEVALTPDTPLFGGDLDLDSLDALLLMQSLEAEFGFKMATEAFGPEVFKNVASLARFVEEQRATA